MIVYIKLYRLPTKLKKKREIGIVLTECIRSTQVEIIFSKDLVFIPKYDIKYLQLLKLLIYFSVLDIN